MRRIFILLFFVLIASLVQTSEARKVALLVGVDSYVNVPSLKCCVNDMKALKEVLMKIGFEEDDIHILVTGASNSKNLPTKKIIENNIFSILKNVQPNDMVFLAFSGHGMQEGKNVYFCPPEVEVDNIVGTCVSINKVMDDLSKCEAKFKWMVVDACRNDPTQGPKGIGGKGLRVIPAPPAGIALFQSCAEGEQSWEDIESKKGFFTKNLVAALSGEADADHDGALTLTEVLTWTTAETQKQVKNRMNRSQRPYFSGTFSDFTLAENINRSKAYKLAAEAQKAVKAENFELAIKKYDEAIALYPLDQWKIERNLLKEILNPGSGSTDGNNPPPSSTQKRSLETPGSRAGEKRTVLVNSVEFTFCWCPSGTFKMGSALLGLYPGLKEKQHDVTLTKGFWMLET
ncbi:MAG: caspase family protein, partial [Thermoguttaceae bacterium]|nr:caspase family protein [Thermoguttaceae bacterium]